MLTTGEQRELRQIENALREQDRGFGRRLTLLQGVLRWAAPGRRRYLLAVAAVAAAALLRVLTATGRLLIEASYWSALALDSSALMASGDVGWQGWDSEPGPGSGPGCA
jgi:Protein of unknown function (DUF3040)